MKWSKLTGAALGVSMALAAAACGGSSDSAEGGEGSYTVGLVGFTSADPTGTAAVRGYTKAAKAKGWKTITVDTQGSTDKAVAAMQNLVSRGVDAIYVSVYPTSQLTAGLVAAKSAKIPVMSLAGGVGDEVQANWAAGSLDGKLVADQLVKDMNSTGSLLVLGFSPGLPCKLREDALKAALKGTSIETTRQELKIPGDTQVSQDFTNAWLPKHPAGDAPLAIWSCNDNGALGAIAALKSQKRSDVKVYGLNGEPGALKAIQDGTLAADAWIDTEAAGAQMAEATPEIVKAGVTPSKPIRRDIPSTLITKETVASFLEEHPTLK